jgi:hypothetical protein
MKLAEDLIGRRFGTRVVLANEKSNARGITRWKVLCDCGLEQVVYRNNLLASKGCRKCTQRRACCRRGHDLTPENVHWNPSKTKRVCKKCRTLRGQTAASKHYRAEYYAANKPLFRKHKKKYKRTSLGKDTERKWRVKHLYTLTREKHLSLLESQKFKCAFPDCGAVVDLYSDIDHNHSCCSGPKSCGKCVRGILCHQHNNGLSFFEDRPKTLLNAFEYLQKELI